MNRLCRRHLRIKSLIEKAAVLIQAPNIETGPRRNAPTLETDV